MPKSDEQILNEFLGKGTPEARIKKKDAQEFQNELSDEEVISKKLAEPNLDAATVDESFVDQAKSFLASPTEEKLQMAKDFLNERVGESKAKTEHFFNTALFGYGPELYGAAAQIIPGGDDYLQARRKAAEELKETERLYPKSAMIGKIGGVLAPGLGAGATIGKALARMGGLASGYQAGSVLGGATEGLLAGGLAGLVQNPGGSETGEISPIQAKERVKNMGVGALGGAILGGFIAPIRRMFKEAKDIAAEREAGIFRAKAGKPRYEDINELKKEGIFIGGPDQPPPLPPGVGRLPELPPPLPPESGLEGLPSLVPPRLPREIKMAPGAAPGLLQKSLQDIEDIGTKLESTVINAIPKYMTSTAGKYAPTMKQDEAVLLKNGIIKEGESMPPALLFGEDSKANAKWLVSADSPADNYKKEYLHTFVKRINNSILDKLDDIAGPSGELTADGKTIPQTYDKAEVGDYVADKFFEGVDKFFSKMEVTYENVGNLIEQEGAPADSKQIQQAINEMQSGINLIVKKALQRSAKEGRGISVKESQLKNIANKADQINKDLVAGLQTGKFSPRKWLKDAAFHIRDLGDVAFGLGENDNDRDFHKRLLREMYGHLRNGIYKVVDAYSPKLKSDLQTVNNAVDSYYRNMGSFVDRIEKEKGAPGGAGEILMRKITEGGNKELYIIRDMMLEGGADPDATLGRLRAYYLSSLIPDNRGENLTFQAIKNIRAQEQKLDILFNTEKAKAKIQDLEQLFETLSRVGKKTMNPSGTSISTRFTYNPLKIAEEEMMLDSDYAQAVARAKRGLRPEELPIEHGGVPITEIPKTNFLRSREFRRSRQEKAPKPPREAPPQFPINPDDGPETPSKAMDKALEKIQRYTGKVGRVDTSRANWSSYNKAMEEATSRNQSPRRNENALRSMPGEIPPLTPKVKPEQGIERFSRDQGGASTDDIDTIERFLKGEEEFPTSNVDDLERFSKDNLNFRTGEALDRRGWVYDKASGYLRNGDFYYKPSKVGQKPDRIKKMTKAQKELENNGQKWWN